MLMSATWIFEHGDTIYADFPPQPCLSLRLQRYKSIAPSSEVYETRFGLNTLGDLRTSTSILATIDDHEVINDFAGVLLTLTPLWQR